MKVVAIDPGYERLGIAVLEKINGREKLLHSECFRTSANFTHPQRLALIGEKIKKVVGEHKTEVLAVEKLFFSVNQKTALAVAEVRGIILYLAAANNLRVIEYSPTEIKIAVTGYGHSSKKQVAEMIKRLLMVKKKIIYDDEFDAIAVGLTFFAREKSDMAQQN